MSVNSFGHMYKVTTWGESHGPSLGATIDGCPPGIEIDQDKLQVWMDKRKPDQTKYTTQRNEPDSDEILSGELILESLFPLIQWPPHMTPGPRINY